MYRKRDFALHTSALIFLGSLIFGTLGFYIDSVCGTDITGYCFCAGAISGTVLSVLDYRAYRSGEYWESPLPEDDDDDDDPDRAMWGIR